MSYSIHYQWRAFQIDLSDFDPCAPRRFVVAIEAGSNNCWTTRNGVDRRARSWEIYMLGTHQQVMSQAVQMAGYAEVGEFRQRGRHITPEGFITKVRRLLVDAVDANSGFGHLVLSARAETTHALASADLPNGFERELDRWYGQDTVLIRPPGMPEWSQFFTLIDPYLDDRSLPPFRCGQVYGLPES